jgi:hypothetical protein
MTTEAEAKEKWCPHIRITGGWHNEGSMTNRCDTPTMTDCIASECMAWRWAMAEAEGCTPLGYCGLGGKP